MLSNRWLLGGLVVGLLLQAAVIFVPGLGQIFHTVPLNLKDVVLICVGGSAVLWVEELGRGGR